MSAEEKSTSSKSGCGVVIGSLLLLAAVLSVLFFCFAVPWLIRKNISWAEKLDIRHIFTEKNAGKSTAPAEKEPETNKENTADDSSEEYDQASDTTAGNEADEPPVIIIDADGNAHEAGSDSWY